MKKPICPNDRTPELPTNTYNATTIAANTSAFVNSSARASVDEAADQADEAEHSDGA